MTQILNKHSDVGIAPETFYFDDLRVKMAGYEQQPLNSEQEKRCENYFLALSHKTYGFEGDPEQGWMSRRDLKTLAQSLGVGTDSYFEAFCQLSAKHNNKQLNNIQLGEKTPSHVFRISEIISYCPDAKIICMIRHPAGIVASYLNRMKTARANQYVPKSEVNRVKKSIDPLLRSLLWKSAFQASLEARSRFGDNHVYIQRFEDLLCHPESSLKMLTSFLSIDFQPAMLDIDQVNSSYTDKWRKSNAGFSQDTIYRWREKLNNAQIAVIQSGCGSLLSEAGYEREPVYEPLAVIGAWINFPFNSIRALLANKNRIGNIPEYINHRLNLIKN